MTHHHIEHCLTKIEELIARPEADPLTCLQLGYNLGRLSELSSGGRSDFWDPWKQPVASWNQQAMSRLLDNLKTRYRHIE